MARNLHAEITSRILESLRKGCAPWRRPWGSVASKGMPRNAITGRSYSGANVCLLWLTSQERNYFSNAWLTFKQAIDVKANVRKGEKGTTVCFVGYLDKTNAEGEKESIPYLKAFTVFNVEQVDNMPAKYLDETPRVLNPHERDALADEFLNSTGARIHYDGGSRAFYRPATDSIHLPAFEAFKSRSAFAGTAFHELVHWTGAVSRCNREFGKRFGDRAYSAEELVAEMGAAFLCAEFGYDDEPDVEQHAAYIENWIRALSSDERIFVAACSKASQAVEFLRRTALASEAEPLSEAA